MSLALCLCIILRIDTYRLESVAPAPRLDARGLPLSMLGFSHDAAQTVSSPLNIYLYSDNYRAAIAVIALVELLAYC